MTVDQHRVADAPVPGGVRQELIQGTLEAGSTETINLKESYSNKPTITGAAGNGSTDEETKLTLDDDDPTSDGNIVVRVTAATTEDKEYHVLVTSPISEDS